VSGRPFQGEAYYAREFTAPRLTAEKLAKLAAVFSLWNVPDLAAELLAGRRSELATLFDLDKGLDFLAAQAQPQQRHKLSYRDYLKNFEADAPWFYRREGRVSLGERLLAAWRAFNCPRD
jgi:hypothetical protein